MQWRDAADVAHPYHAAQSAVVAAETICVPRVGHVIPMILVNLLLRIFIEDQRIIIRLLYEIGNQRRLPIDGRISLRSALIKVLW